MILKGQLAMTVLRSATNSKPKFSAAQLGTTALAGSLALVLVAAPVLADINNAGSLGVPDGGIIIDAGSINNLATGSISFAGSGTVASGTGIVTNAGRIEVRAGPVGFSGAALTNTGTAIIDGTGSVFDIGTVVNSGSIGLAGTATATVTGLVTNNSGGGIQIGAANTLTAGGLTNNSGGTVGLLGTLDLGVAALDNTGIFSMGPAADLDAGSILNNAGGEFFVDGNTDLTGGLVNNGTMTVQETATAFNIGADSANSGTLQINGGATAVTGSLTNTGTINVSAGTLSATAIDNQSALTVNGSGAVTADITNSGTLTLATTGTAVTGNVIGAGGTLNVNGSQTITGNVTGVQTIDLTTASNVNGVSTLTIGGTLDGGNTINLDLYPGAAAGTDTIIVTGGAGTTAATTLNFNNQVSGGLQNTAQDLIIAGGGTAFDVNNFTLGTGVSTVGTIVTSLEQNGNNIGYISQINPAIGGLAGGLALSQSLISSVVNRPTSAFGGGLAVESGNNCGPGTWGRVSVGSATVDGSSNNGASDTASSSSLNYEGIQLGGDVGCYQGAYNGWDIAIGGTLGFNTGEITTSVPTTGTSNTVADFDQLYVGAYVLAANGPLRMDFQFRGDENKYVLNNSDLGLNDADYSTSSMTLSGSVSYAFPLNDAGLVVIPTGGLALTRTKADAIFFEADPLTNTPASTLTQGEYNSKVAFIGSTLAKTSINADGVSATTSFVTATYYNDFSDDLASNFTIGSTTQAILTTSERSYGELSAGLNYVRILDGGGATAAKQMNLAIRADARIGDDIDGYGLTANFRFQF